MQATRSPDVDAVARVASTCHPSSSRESPCHAAPRRLPPPVAVAGLLAVARRSAHGGPDRARPTRSPTPRSPRADHVTIRGGGSSALVDVLRNDSDPNGDDLAICRFEVPDGVPAQRPRLTVSHSSTSSEDPDGREQRMKLLVHSTRLAGPAHYDPDLLRLRPRLPDARRPSPSTIERTQPVRARKVPAARRELHQPRRPRGAGLLQRDRPRPRTNPTPTPTRATSGLRPGRGPQASSVEGRIRCSGPPVGRPTAATPGDGASSPRLDRP